MGGAPARAPGHPAPPGRALRPRARPPRRRLPYGLRARRTVTLGGPTLVFAGRAGAARLPRLPRLRKTRCRIEALRSRIVLLLAEGRSVAEVAQIAGCVRATVYYTLYRFEDAGEEGLVDGRRAPEARKLTPQVLDRLVAYVERTPRELGWHRCTWTLELMARQLRQETGVALSTGYLGRVLRALGIRRGRPRPALRIPVKGRRAVLNAIDALVASASAGEEVLYADVESFRDYVERDILAMAVLAGA